MARELHQRHSSLSLRGIGKRLAEAGILSPSGRVLDHSSVRRMLG